MSDLRQQLLDRLETLRREQEIGEERLRVLERESIALQQTLLRISGAIQVIEELTDAQSPVTKQPAPV